MRSSSVRGILGVGVAVAVLAGAGSAQAAVKYLLMDAFKPVYQQLPGGSVAQSFPSRLGAFQPSSTLNSYLACAQLRLPAGSRIREITYASEGSSGSSSAFLQEYRYAEYNHLRGHNVSSYPTAELEKTMLATTDPFIPVRRGFRYYLCVSGQSGAGSNEFLGFKITFRRP